MSWLHITKTSHFPIQNLPYGVFSLRNDPVSRHRIGVAIGTWALDLATLHEHGLLNDLGYNTNIFTEATLNSFMKLGKPSWSATRARLKSLLAADGSDDRLRSDDRLKNIALIPFEDINLHLPATIGDYTDFYSSREHASNIGRMLRDPTKPLQPNWLHLPVGYHGRASSVVISGTNVVRPHGQLQTDREDPSKGSHYGPSMLLDFELEVAYFIGGQENPLGIPLTISEAADRIFGLVVMNDWSARDLQAWEYVPLGPFTAKNFCTSISPWIVSLEALEEFKCSSSAGPVQVDPTPLPYLQDPDYATGTFDIRLEVAIQGQNDVEASTVCVSNLKYLYWNFKQQLVHHAVSGCHMRPGDLLATGTVSGPTDDALGSMMELSWRGSREVILSNAFDKSNGDDRRKFLRNGDTVIMTAFAQGPDYRIGFGEVRGTIVPSSVRPSAPEENKISVVEGSAIDVRSFKETLRLFSYWRSSSSHRVRIALELKGLKYTYIPINLLLLADKTVNKLPKELSERNPQEQIPVLEFEQPGGEVVRIAQSVAIIEFLDEIFPSSGPSLLPADARQRAIARQITEIVNSGIQPYQNVGFARQVKSVQILGTETVTQDSTALTVAAITKGLASIEALITQAWAKYPGINLFSAGTSSPTIADAALIPQVYSALRFNIDIASYPKIKEVFDLAESLPAFKAASPINQIDAQK